MQTINERTSAWLTVAFKDKAGALAVPTSVSYRIDCLTTGIVMKADTSVAAASSVEIALSATVNAINTQTNVREQRRVTVTAQYGDNTDQIVAEFDYFVRNLQLVS